MIPPFAQIVRTLIPSFLLAQLCFHSIASADVEKGRTAANRGDFETALSEWRASAQQGDSEAKYLLGRLYANGDGVQRDFQAAFQWFLAAAKAGHRGAQQALAKMYERGDGVQKDRTKAALWRSGKGSGEDEASEAPPVKKVSLTSMNGRVAKNDTRLAEPTVAGGVSLGSSDDFTKVPESATQREGLSPPVGSETKRDQPKASASTGGGEPSLGSHSDIIAAGGASPTAASLPTLSRWNGVCPTSTSSQAEKEDFEQAVAELFHLGAADSATWFSNCFRQG
ncbi:MAG: sel1 repeat family protein [Gemmataceae bacterium]|nr:sel1 repeat family protein [Gemmataceae bacterium]